MPINSGKYGREGKKRPFGGPEGQSATPDILRTLWKQNTNMIRYMIYLLTAIGLTPCGSSTVHIYTQIHRKTQTIHRTTQ